MNKYSKTGGGRVLWNTLPEDTREMFPYVEKIMKSDFFETPEDKMYDKIMEDLFPEESEEPGFDITALIIVLLAQGTPPAIIPDTLLGTYATHDVENIFATLIQDLEDAKKMEDYFLIRDLVLKSLKK